MSSLFRNFLRKMTVRKRMMFAFVLIAVLPFLLACIYILQSAHSSFQRRNISYANDYARQSYVGVNQIFLSIYETFHRVSDNSDILADVYNYIHINQYRNDHVAGQICNALWAGASKNNTVSVAAVMTQDGSVLQSGSVVIPEDYLRLMKSTVPTGSIETNFLVMEQVPYLILHQVTSLRYDRPDTVLFVVGVNLEQLSVRSQDFMAGDMQEMWVVDSSNQTLLHSNPEALLRKLPPPEDAWIMNLESGDFRLISLIHNGESTTMRMGIWVMMAAAAIVLPILWVGFWALSQSVTEPTALLLQKMKGLGRDDILLAEEINGDEALEGQGDEISMLEREFTAMLRCIRNLIETVYLKNIHEQKLKYKIRELELSALQQQINPHFLYNVLDNIFWRSEMSGGGITSKLITALGNYFMISTNTKGILVSVESELQNVRSYLYLQQHMLGERFQVEWKIQEHVKNYQMVKLTLQPIVENSIVHGLSELESGGVITIQADLQGSDILFIIRDNGKGMDAQQLLHLQKYVDSKDDPAGSVGLRNVNRRIRNYYGERYAGLYMDSVPGQGTVTRIIIPQKRGEVNDV